MQRADSPRREWRKAVFFLTALLVVAADQLSKIWVRKAWTNYNLAIGESLFEVGFFRIIHAAPNTGAAFGLFRGHLFALTIVSLVGVVAILVYAFLIDRRFPLLHNTLSKIALGLVLGGAVGNLVDRLNPSLDGVTDFISVGDWWPAFNIADPAITVGVILFICSLLSLARAENTDVSA